MEKESMGTIFLTHTDFKVFVAHPIWTQWLRATRELFGPKIQTGNSNSKRNHGIR